MHQWRCIFVINILEFLIRKRNQWLSLVYLSQGVGFWTQREDRHWEWDLNRFNNVAEIEEQFGWVIFGFIVGWESRKRELASRQTGEYHRLECSFWIEGSEGGQVDNSKGSTSEQGNWEESSSGIFQVLKVLQVCFHKLSSPIWRVFVAGKWNLSQRAGTGSAGFTATIPKRGFI